MSYSYIKEVFTQSSEKFCEKKKKKKKSVI